MTIDHQGAVPKYLQLVRIIRKRIESGEIPAGRAIPSEVELEQEFDLSRGTVRAAIRRLREDGVIFTVHGKGSFAGPAPEDDD
ncbi:MAG TPA: GntR family transcriptional regulator [Spirillospora sp.]|nr:GntR family transcriptional regulator [Spirillospora sp.]